jgi:DNA-directed RNA polymerase subunit RPC12/RpoP
MILLLIPATLVAVVVGTTFGWKWILAPLLGIAIWKWSSATLRSMVADGRSQIEDAPRPVGSDERTLYWCEECGTELLLIVRGAGTAPRHCGTRMHERSEILN